MTERREDIGQRAVMGLVIRRLYFGQADRKVIAMNGRILKQWYAKGWSWDALARAVEGLAIRRDRGELHGVDRAEPVSLRWWQGKQTLNQFSMCLDAFYREAPKAEPKRGGVTTMADILSHWSKSA